MNKPKKCSRCETPDCPTLWSRLTDDGGLPESLVADVACSLRLHNKTAKDSRDYLWDMLSRLMDR